MVIYVKTIGHLDLLSETSLAFPTALASLAFLVGIRFMYRE
jgi:hypothetical protein